MVDHRRGLDDPGVRQPRGWVGPFLGTEHGRLLLGFAYEQHAFRSRKACPVLGSDVVLAFFAAEREERNLILLDEGFHAANEVGTDRLHESRRSKSLPPMEAKERNHPAVVLQFRLVDVEVHAVDAFDFQGHFLRDDFGNRAWYTHGWLRSTRALRGPTTASSGQIGDASSIPRPWLDRSLFLCYILSV